MARKPSIVYVNNLPATVFELESGDESEEEIQDYLKNRRSSTMGRSRRNSFCDEMSVENRSRRLSNALQELVLDERGSAMRTSKNSLTVQKELKLSQL